MKQLFLLLLIKQRVQSLVLNIYGVDEGEVGVARTTAYSVAHGGWVGLTTYNDCDGNLRVKSEVLVAMSGISTGSTAYGSAGDAADDTFFGDA